MSDLLRRTAEAARNVAGVRILSFDSEILSWLPRERTFNLEFDGPYPDRSNLTIRQHFDTWKSNDPDSRTPDGKKEAKAFFDAYLNPEDPPF